MVNYIQNMLKIDSERIILSLSNDSSKTEQCCFEKKALNVKLLELIEQSGYTLKGSNLKTVWNIVLQFQYVISKGIT